MRVSELEAGFPPLVLDRVRVGVPGPADAGWDRNYTVVRWGKGMSLVRHDSGGDDGSVRGVARAYWSQVHPVFMLPPVAASLFGAILAGDGAAIATTAGAVVHAVAIFAAVYTAHLKDGYVDFHHRGEDDDHPLTERGCRVGLVASSTLFAVACLLLWTVAGWLAVVLTVPTWAIAYHHAPQLDTNPLTATTGYPLGIALAILGGYAVQTGTVSPVALGFALVFLVLLSGIKVIDDAQDYDYDRSIDKITVAVRVGPDRAHRVAYGLMATALVVVVTLAAGQVFPPTAALAALAFAAVATFASRAEPELATMLLVRGSYVFLAVLVAAVWFQPLSSLGV